MKTKKKYKMITYPIQILLLFIVGSSMYVLNVSFLYNTIVYKTAEESG